MRSASLDVFGKSKSWAMLLAVVGLAISVGPTDSATAALLGPHDIVAPTAINPDTGLPWAPGDKYQLVFVTDATTDAISPTITTYDAFVNARANASSQTGVAETTWYAIGSTVNPTVDANTHALVSAPVYRLDGVLVATGYADMWDSSLQAPITVDQNLNAQTGSVWTGTNPNGTVVSNRYLGNATTVRFGAPSQYTDQQWIDDFNFGPPTDQRHMYALSELLTIQGAAAAGVPEPSTIALSALGLLGLVVYGLRRRR